VRLFGLRDLVRLFDRQDLVRLFGRQDLVRLFGRYYRAGPVRQSCLGYTEYSWKSCPCYSRCGTSYIQYYRNYYRSSKSRSQVWHRLRLKVQRPLPRFSIS